MSYFGEYEGGSASSGFIARMMAENRVKHKGKYGPTTDLPKGSKMDSPAKFDIKKIANSKQLKHGENAKKDYGASPFLLKNFGKEESKNPLYKKSGYKLYKPPTYRTEVPETPFKLQRKSKKTGEVVQGGGKMTEAFAKGMAFAKHYVETNTLHGGADSSTWYNPSVDPTTTKGWYVDEDRDAWYDGVRYTGNQATWQEYIDKNVAPDPRAAVGSNATTPRPGPKQLGPAPPAPIKPAPTDYSYIPKGYAYGLPPLNPGWVLDETDDSLWKDGVRMGHISDKDVSHEAINAGPNWDSNEWGVFESGKIETNSSGETITGMNNYLDSISSTTRTLPNGQRITAPIDPYKPNPSNKSEITTTADGVKGKVQTYQFNPGWVLDQWDNGLWKDGVYKGPFDQFKEEAVYVPPKTAWTEAQKAQWERQNREAEASYYAYQNSQPRFNFFDSLGRLVADIYSIGTGAQSAWDYGTAAYVSVATGNPLPILGMLVYDAAGEIVPELVGLALKK